MTSTPSLRILIVALLAPRPARAAGTACTSTKADDATHEGCFGWCEESQASAHCEYCKCQACPWCQRAVSTIDGGGGDGGGGGTTDASGATCSSEVAGDATFEDCQDFCSPQFADSHCGMCKCRACAMCSCSSDYADDASKPECQDWCSAEFFEDHCSRCKCKGCGFCRAGQACASGIKDDSAHEQCDDFCDAAFGKQHCEMCKCKRCGFCGEGGGEGGAKGKQCSSDAPIGVWDSPDERCEDFCSAEHRDSHCGLCKCKACDLCKCHSAVEGDAADATCEDWCSVSEWQSHCQTCKCRGCGFCVHGAPCSPHDTTDSTTEMCEPWCDQSVAKAHCQQCKCRGCKWCSDDGRKYPPVPPKPPSPPRPPPAAKPRHARPPGALRSPEPPRDLRAEAVGCGSLPLHWTAPYDKGTPIDTYEVLYRRADEQQGGGDAEPSHFDTGSSKPATELTGLSPSATYQLRVRAHNEGGWGLLSSTAVATTDAALHPPLAPLDAPGMLGSTCSALTLRMPRLRGGCSGDEYHSLQWREAAIGARAEEGWHTWRAADASTRVPSRGELTLQGLRAAAAYEARVVAHNAKGSSAAGPPSPPFALGVSSKAMQAAPVAAATSAASVAVAWPGCATDCRPEQAWEVLVQRRIEGGDALGEAGGEGAGWAAWSTVAVVRAGAFEALSLRCAAGCRFRMHARNITGWSLYSNASAVVRTPAEPPIPQGALRLEVAMRRVRATDGPTDAAEATAERQRRGDQLISHLASSLGVGAERLALAGGYDPLPAAAAVAAAAVAASGGGAAAGGGAKQPAQAAEGAREGLSLFVVDLRDGGDGAEPTPAALALKLAEGYSAHSPSLFSEVAGARLDAAQGLQQVQPDGAMVALWAAATDETAARLATAMRITVSIVVAVLLLGCGASIKLSAHRAVAAGSASAGGREEKKRLHDDDDDDDDDDEDDDDDDDDDDDNVRPPPRPVNGQHRPGRRAVNPLD